MRDFMKYIIITILVLCGISPVLADENTDADQVELNSLTNLEEKLRQHPEIQAYVHKAESAKYYAKGELGLPDPMVFFAEQDYPIGSSMSQDQEQKMLGFRQDIPRPALLKARSGKVAAESRKQQLLADYAFAAMKAKMISALASLKKVKELEAIAKEQEKLLKAEVSSTKGRISSNQASFSQLSMTEAEAIEAKMTLSDLEEEHHDIEAMLTNMLGEVPGITLPPIEMVMWNDDPTKTYPVIIASADIDMANKDVDTRKAEFGPNFQVQTSYGRMYGGDNAGTLMVGLSIPLWMEQSQKPKLAGAKAALSAAQLDQETMKREVIEKLSRLVAQINASNKKLELLKHKQSILKTASGATSREYSSGKADLGMILKTKREVLAVKAALATEEAKHTSLIADFNRYIIGEKQ